MKHVLYRHILKRGLDIVGATALGLATAPIMAATAVAIKATSKGPVIFQQERLGKDEKPFKIYKFRSMYTEAPSLPPYMLKDPDAFITPLGKWLRKSSIDELPQILNVLKGDMSFVGPRPGAATNEEDLRLERRKRGVFDIRPGITGWAQVNGRDELAANPVEKAEYDSFYAKHISLFMDLRCLFNTVSTVALRDGYVEGSSAQPRRRKVLFLIHTLGGGGAEKVLVDLTAALDPKLFDVTVMTVIDTGIYKEQLAPHVTYKTMIKIPSFLKRRTTDSSGTLNAEASAKTKLAASIYAKLWWFMPAQAIHRVFIHSHYDVEVAFLEGIPAKIISGSTDPRARKLAWIHTDFAKNHKSAQFFKTHDSELRRYGRFDKIIFVSEESRQGFIQEVGEPIDSMVTPNPINIARIEALGETPLDASSAATYSPDHFDLTVVGRLVPVKAIDRLITVVKDLRTEGTAIDLHVVGDGQERTNLQELAADAPFIHFHGYQTNPYPYIKNSDLFLIPSHAEGFSTVMLEALLLSVPVMSTRVSGSSFLEDEQVIDNTTDALRAALHSIVTDEDAAENIARASTAGRQKVVDSVSANLHAIEGLLSNSLNAQP